MKFTEREMTVAVEAVAKQVFAATQPPWRRGKAEASWETLAPVDRYYRKAGVGEAVLPALLALPERPTVGAPPAFTPEEYADAAEAATRQLMDQRSPGQWEGLAEKKRARLVEGAVALTRAAVEAMPIRQDPDAIVVPDHL